jgi:hypothetical protein
MTIAVFVGPTLWNDAILATPGISWQPPARCGDLYRVAKRKAAAIGLIDGRFETVASPWHKEILWALSRGIPVFGAASMGALRAAELAPYGMRGVGTVYRAYAAGTLCSDDEVAVLHAGPELGYRPLSEALVDIRATLAAARRAGVISKTAAERLITIAGALFYKDRTWPALLARAGRDGAKLQAWLVHHRVEAKRADARQLIGKLKGLQRIPMSKPAFSFQRTHLWGEFTEDWSARKPAGG